MSSNRQRKSPSRTFAARLRQAIADEVIALASGDRAGFMIALGAEPATRPIAAATQPAPPSAFADMVAALAQDGFRAEAAHAVLAASRSPGARWLVPELTAVRRFWLEWCAQLDAADRTGRGGRR